MVKEFSGSYTFPYRWDIVSACFWVKYPNPFSNHVLSEDVFSRFISDKGVLITKKLLVKKSNLHIPKWGEKFITIKNGYVVEETHVDPINQVLTSYTKNISLTSLLTVVEKCVYSKDPSDPTKTQCVKTANFYSPLMLGTGAAIEQYAVRKFKRNADRASMGFNWILEKFKVKGFA